MKKTSILVVFALFFLSISSSTVWAKGTIKLGFEPGGNLSTNISGYMLGYGVDYGFSVAGEYLHNLNEQVELGGGIEYQFNRRVKGLDTGFSFIPVYGTLKLHAPLSEGFDSYFTAKIGYNYLSLSESLQNLDYGGGFFYSLGAGIDLNTRYAVEVEYAVNRAELGYIFKQPFNYSKIRLSAGYKF